MFSATIPSGVEELAKSVMSSNMIRIIIGGSDMATSTITQELMYTGNEDGKLLALKNLIRSGHFTTPALIFVQSIDRAKDLSKELQAFNIKSDVMHSERTKDARDRVVQNFAEAKLWTLVCTDIMSRGIDFRGVELVVKYVSFTTLNQLIETSELDFNCIATTFRKVSNHTFIASAGLVVPGDREMR